MTDIFNNLTNDYINPDLAPCAGEADESYFEFLHGEQVGIISGSNVISALGLSSIEQSIDGYVQQSKILQSGEITYIPGMTKGIEEQVQYFPWDGSVVYTGSNHMYYMSVNVSINYYSNFRYYQNGFIASADPTEETTIENAIDIALAALGVSVDSTYDSSGLTFTGETAGYWFDVTAVDVSLWDSTYPMYAEEIIAEDVSSKIPAFKYPNGGMLGYVLKVTYPTTAEDYEKYVKINHVPDYLTYYSPISVSEFRTQATYEASTYWDASSGGSEVDVSVFLTYATYETSTCYDRDYDAVDVGASGTSCDPDAITAADYLDKVETNNLWEKVGPLRIWITAEDEDDSTEENLITGFYVYNPQTFSVQIDYMTII